MGRILISVLAIFLAGCNQYRCYDGTYVEDAYRCFDHGGLSYYSYIPRAISKPKSNSMNVAGTWDIRAKRTSGSCVGVPSSIQQPIVISQSGSSLTFSIPGIGRYKGRLTSKNAKVSGRDFSLCSVSFNSDISFQTSSALTLNGSFKALCFGGYSCSMSIEGNAKKRAATSSGRAR